MQGFRLIRLIQQGLERNSGALRLVADRAGVSYSWLCKVKQGRLKDPGYANVEKLATSFFGGIYTHSEVEFVLRQHVTQAQAQAILDQLGTLLSTQPPAVNAAAADQPQA